MNVVQDVCTAECILKRLHRFFRVATVQKIDNKITCPLYAKAPILILKSVSLSQSILVEILDAEVFLYSPGLPNQWIFRRA